MMLNEFLLIGRNFRHWQACLNSEKSKPDDLNPTNLRQATTFIFSAIFVSLVPHF